MRTVSTDRLIVVVGPSHPWTTRRTVTVEDLLGIKWILREKGSGTRSAFEAALSSKGVDPKRLQIWLELPSNEAVRSVVELGDCATVVSELVVEAYIASGRLVKIPFELPKRTFRLLRHLERYQTKASAAFEAVLK